MLSAYTRHGRSGRLRVLGAGILSRRHPIPYGQHPDTRGQRKPWERRKLGVNQATFHLGPSRPTRYGGLHPSKEAAARFSMHLGRVPSCMGHGMEPEKLHSQP